MKLRKVCSGCGRVLAAGDAPEPVSHGICEPCIERLYGREMLMAVRRRMAGREQVAEVVA